ncbi:Deoxyribonuclease Tat-D [Ceratocystis platani]|uniref:Deoxyribonuclease Tat-D n=1 Tax=Ceratocystis fimbriata f. sp. platani TaxID=88771 RepID=A0A0F8AWT2_CERFI|nr:Deoxyribonuclease Tat-D [Ceratocystis platani]
MQQQLPLFLHSRAAHRDFVDLLKKHYGPRLEKLEKGGVVHSFTGTIEEMTELMDLGLYIGVNGCSLKTAENCEAVKAISLNRIMLETDGPWCEVRPSHEGWKYLLPNEGHTQADIASTIIDSKVPAKKKNQPKKPEPKITEVTDIYKVVKKEKWVEGCMVKGRNEPCMIGRVATIVAGIKGITVEELCKHAWENTTKVFRVVDDCKYTSFDQLSYASKDVAAHKTEPDGCFWKFFIMIAIFISIHKSVCEDNVKLLNPNSIMNECRFTESTLSHEPSFLNCFRLWSVMKFVFRPGIRVLYVIK